MESEAKRPRLDSDAAEASEAGASGESDSEASSISLRGNATVLPKQPAAWGHDISDGKADLQDGPSSYADIAAGDWADHMLGQAELLDDRYMDTLVSNLAEGVVLTSSFSGLGSDALVAHMIEERAAASGIGGALLAGSHVHAACDISEACQQVLLCHTGKHKPKHVFTDIVQLIPEKDRVAMQCALDQHRSKVEDAVASVAPGSSAEYRKTLRKEVVDSESEVFFSFAARLARRWKFCRDDKAWCVACSAFCRRWPASGGLHIEIAGTICVGHSSMGAQWGWLDNAAIPAIVWATCMRQIKPHCIVHELGP